MISHSWKLKRYCSEPLENIENYEKAIADTEHMWDCHHRAEILPCGRFTAAQLKKHGLYWHRPSSELIFLRSAEHNSLHHTGNKFFLGKSHSDETKRRIAEKSKGRNHSLETRRKMSASQTNRPDVSTPIEMTRTADGFTKVFLSQQEAARWLRENGFPKACNGNISKCCRGIHAYAYGAKWRIVDE